MTTITTLREALKTAGPEPHEVVFGEDTEHDFEFTRDIPRSRELNMRRGALDPGYRERSFSTTLTAPSEARVFGGVWLPEEYGRDDLLFVIADFADWAQFVYDHSDDCEWAVDCEEYDDRPSLWVGAHPRYTVEVTDRDGDRVYWEIVVAYPVGMEIE